MRQQIGRRDEHVRAQVADLAALGVRPARGERGLGLARLARRVGDGGAVVETVVGELAEVLRPEVIVESVPAVDERAEVEGAEVEVGEGREQAQAGEEPAMAGRPAGVAGASGWVLRAAPPGAEEQGEPEEGERQLPPAARGVVPSPGAALRRPGGRGVDHLQLRLPPSGLGAEGLDFGDRGAAVAARAADAEVADRRGRDAQRARPQAVLSVEPRDLAEPVEADAVSRAFDEIGVVGVRLHQQRAQRARTAEVESGDGPRGEHLHRQR